MDTSKSEQLPPEYNVDNIALEEISRDDAASPPTMETNKKYSRVLSQESVYNNRKISKIQAREEREGERIRCLTSVRQIVENYADASKEMSQNQLEDLFHCSQLNLLLFNLFDDNKSGFLHQQTWMEGMKGSYDSFAEAQRQRLIEFVELLETTTYIICRDEDVGENVFGQIWSTKGLAVRFSRIMGSEGATTVDHFMDIVMKITASRCRDKSVLSKESIERLEKVFKSKAGEENGLDLDHFKSIYPAKNHFFVERCFKIFDKDSNGKVSLPELIETMHQFSEQGEEEKISFLFKMFDLNNSGTIDEHAMEEMMKACMKESGLELCSKDVKDLSNALYQDAVRCKGGKGCDGITIEDLKIQLKKYDGLIESMNLSIDQWLLLPKQVSKKASLISPIYLLSNYWVNNKAFIFFVLFITMANVGLFIHRAHYFRNFQNLDGSSPNIFYMLSRGCGRVLLFNSALVVVLVFRHSITSLRNSGFGMVLPLDHNIYLHKVVGWIIGAQSLLHTIMHLFNFGLNVQPDPVRFVQLNDAYWDVSKLGYNIPPKCQLLSNNVTSLNGSDLPLYQSCQDDSSPWSYFDWIMTMKPGVFGLIGGIANPTGVALIIIIIAMTFFSLPFIRRSGFFQLFYYTHMLYVLYFILLILHAPEFWKWIVGPGIIFLIERLNMMVTTYLGHGKTVIRDGMILPSRVTKLVIERPAHFIFKTGDWVFVKIPELVGHEWHAFTISSSPEMLKTMTLHIRAVGGWTNEVYSHFHKKMLKHQKAKARVGKSLSDSFLIRKNQDSVKHIKSLSAEYSSSINLLNIQEQINAGTDECKDIAKIEDGTYFAKQSKQLDIYIDGPFGSPSSDIYRAEHAVLICTGIGVTPYASILQSIMMRYRSTKHFCLKCKHQSSNGLPSSMFSLKKVDFLWVNRDQKAFEWFIQLLSQLEVEQSEIDGAMSRFLDMEMYMTSALQITDMKAVLLQMALDLIHKKENRDILTGLHSRIKAGRPNWNKVFTKVREQNKGKVTVFYCGNPVVSKILKKKCAEFGFNFKKEIFC